MLPFCFMQLGHGCIPPQPDGPASEVGLSFSLDAAGAVSARETEEMPATSVVILRPAKSCFMLRGVISACSFPCGASPVNLIALIKIGVWRVKIKVICAAVCVSRLAAQQLDHNGCAGYKQPSRKIM